MRLVSFSIGVLAALCGTSIALANTAFNLGAAGNFGAITGFGSFTTNNGGINGLVGIESGGFFSSSGPGTISGVEFQDAVVDGGYTDGTAISSSRSLSGSNNSVNNTNITGGMIQNAALLASAATSIASLESLANSTISGGTAVDLNIGNGSTTLTAAASGTTVYDATNVNIGNGGKITISGGANSLLIINVSGTFNAQNNTAGAGIVLTGGITADQIIWNITSTGNNFTSSGNAATNIVYGDFLDLAGSYNLNQITVDGRLFGANSDGGNRAGLTDQIVSVFNLNAPPPQTEHQVLTGTPEPSTWALGMLGAAIIGFSRVRRVQQS